MSASAFPKQVLEENPFSLARRQAALLNCPTDTSQRIKDCLMKKDAQEIASSLGGFAVSTIWKIVFKYSSVWATSLTTGVQFSAGE
jgi:hypothetical protein